MCSCDHQNTQSCNIAVNVLSLSAALNSYQGENHRCPAARRENEHNCGNKLVLWGALMPSFCYPVWWGQLYNIVQLLRWRLALQSTV